MNNKNLLVLLVAGLSLSVNSCDKEESLKDRGTPTVKLALSGNPARLYNEVKLSATSTDNNTVSRIVYYLNNDSIGVATEKPFEVKWNTKAVEDGKYVLKAVTYDLKNNKAEATQEVNIKNTLLKVFIEEDYIASKNSESKGYEEWVFLSDKEGKTLGAAKQITNETMISWQRPNDFYSDTVYLNKIYIRAFRHDFTGAKEYKYYDINTYSNFSLDEINFKTNTYNRNEAIGSVGITVNNYFDDTKTINYRTSVPGHTTSIGERYLSSVSYNVSMYNNQEKGFTSYGFTNPDGYSREKYYRLDDFITGKDYTFHVDEFKPMDAQKISLPADFSNLYLYVYGYLKDDSQTGYPLDAFYQWDSNRAPAEIEVFYADKVFPNVRTIMSGRNGNKQYYINRNSKFAQSFTIPNLLLNISDYSTKNAEVGSKGNIDMGALSWSYSKETETEVVKINQHLFFSDEPGKYKLPELPSEVLAKYPVFANVRELKYDYTYLSENKAIETYEEMLQYWFTNKFQGQDLNESTTLYIYPEVEEVEGGRIKNKPADPKADMKREELRTRGIWY